MQRNGRWVICGKLASLGLTSKDQTTSTMRSHPVDTHEFTIQKKLTILIAVVLSAVDALHPTPQFPTFLPPHKNVVLIFTKFDDGYFLILYFECFQIGDKLEVSPWDLSITLKPANSQRFLPPRYLQLLFTERKASLSVRLWGLTPATLLTRRWFYTKTEHIKLLSNRRKIAMSIHLNYSSLTSNQKSSLKTASSAKSFSVEYFMSLFGCAGITGG